METWEAYLAGRSGLIHAPTGVGKSYAAWLGSLIAWLDEHPDIATRPTTAVEPLRVLWITPLRALAHDTAATLRRPVDDLGLPWSVELRTGDTSAHRKARQRTHLPTALVTTPESLTLLLSYPETRQQFRTLRCVIVDEWHELLGTKRGVQIELALARLRTWQSDLRVWGLSATLGNLDQALAVLLGREEAATQSVGQTTASDRCDILATGGAQPASLISGATDKTIVIETLVPPNIERFPWAGHLGHKLLPAVVEKNSPGAHNACLHQYTGAV
jgi:ATP-dependent Lhr-like helicase